MITPVKIIGANKLLSAMGKALFVSNIINTVSFFGIGSLIIWQVWRGTEGVKKLGTKIDESKK